MDVHLLVSEYNSGSSYSALSKKYGIPQTSLRRLLGAQPGFVPRQPPNHANLRRQMLLDYQAGMNQGAIATKYGYSQGSVSLLLRQESNYQSREHPSGYSLSWTQERIAKAAALYATGMSIGAVAQAVGSNGTRTRNALRDHGVRIRQQAEAQTGQNNGFWKGGRKLDKPGRDKAYWLVRMPDHPLANGGYIQEHRLVMEEKIGRHLRKGEVVHHIDGDSLNNHPDNLQLFASNAEHLAFELQGRVPKWTEDGKRRILEGVSKPRKPYNRTRRPRNDDLESQSSSAQTPKSPAAS